MDAPEISILLLGDSEVGKSAFLSRMSSGQDALRSKLPEPLRDLDQPFIYDIRMYNRPYRFEFSDTASPENYTLLRPNVIVLCFDISNKETLRSIPEKWRQELHTHFLSDRELPILIMGLKRDLRRENDDLSVMPFEGYQCAQAMRCDAYMECSALTGELVREAFEDIAKVAAKTTTDTGGLSQGGCVVS